MTSTCSSDDESTVRRRAEEHAIQELEAQRRASRQRVLNVWDSLEKRYSRPIEEDDIVDLESLTLLQDVGTIRKMQDIPYGSLSLATSDNEDDEDELAVWDDDHSAEATLYRGKSQLSEVDLRDLQDFLRAERLRREAQGEDDEGSQVVQQREEEFEGQSEEKEEEEEETSEEEENLEAHEAISVSSTRQSVTEEQGTDSEDELGVQPLEPLLRKDTYSSAQEEESEEEASSEDEIAASDDGYVEYVRPVKPSASIPPKLVEKTREPHRTTGNPQLFTPPLSKSSVLSSTPEASGSRILWKPRASSVLPPKMRTGETHQLVRGESVRPPVQRPNVPPPRPQSLLGKRKLSPPMYRPIQGLVDPSDHLSQGTMSSRKIGPERRTKSQDERLPQNRPIGTESSYIRDISYSPEKWSHDGPGDQLHGIITPSDLSQLVYHLREVNEWVKSHQIADFDFGGHSESSSYPTPVRPPRTSLDSYVTPPHAAFRRGSHPSSVLSQSASSTAGPPPTPAHLFDSSPIKHKPQRRSDDARLTISKRLDVVSESSRKRSQQYGHRRAEDARRLDHGSRPQLSRPSYPREQKEIEDRFPNHRHSANVKLDRDDLFSPQVVSDRSRQNASRSVRPRLY